MLALQCAVCVAPLSCCQSGDSFESVFCQSGVCSCRSRTLHLSAATVETPSRNPPPHYSKRGYWKPTQISDAGLLVSAAQAAIGWRELHKLCAGSHVWTSSPSLSACRPAVRNCSKAQFMPRNDGDGKAESQLTGSNHTNGPAQYAGHHTSCANPPHVRATQQTSTRGQLAASQNTPPSSDAASTKHKALTWPGHSCVLTCTCASHLQPNTQRNHAYAGALRRHTAVPLAPVIHSTRRFLKRSNAPTGSSSACCCCC